MKVSMKWNRKDSKFVMTLSFQSSLDFLGLIETDPQGISDYLDNATGMTQQQRGSADPSSQEWLHWWTNLLLGATQDWEHWVHYTHAINLIATDNVLLSEADTPSLLHPIWAALMQEAMDQCLWMHMCCTMHMHVLPCAQLEQALASDLYLTLYFELSFVYIMGSH